MDTNLNIQRLDRAARRYGVAMTQRGKNGREFDALGRRYVVRPGGKGVLKVEVFYPTAVPFNCRMGAQQQELRREWEQEATIYCGTDRIERLFQLAQETRS